MCLVPTTGDILTATEVMTVYKDLTEYKYQHVTQYFSIYQMYRYVPGVVNETAGWQWGYTEEHGRRLGPVNYGFHAWTRHKGRGKYVFHIPEGAKYILGRDHEIVTNKIIFTGDTL